MTHSMNRRETESCTKETKTTKNPFTGTTRTTTKITPCDRDDCPAKKHGFGDEKKEDKK